MGRPRVGRRALLSAWAARLEEHTPAGRGATAAGIALFPFFAEAARTVQMVIVGQFRALRNVADGLDKDAPALYDRFAVRVTRVVDKARLVPLLRSVDDRFVVDGKEKCVRPLHGIVVIALIRFAVRDAFAEIFDHPGARRDRPGGKRAQTLNRRGAKLKPRLSCD